MMLKRLKPALAVLVALALAACASDPSDRFIEGQSSFVTGERYFKANMRTYPVTIMSIDGRDTTLKWLLVQPGPRVLRLQGAPPPGWRVATAITAIKLLVQPLVVWLLALLLGLPPVETQAVVLLAALSVGVNVYLMAREFDALQGPVATSMVMSTALSALTVPLVLALVVQ